MSEAHDLRSLERAVRDALESMVWQFAYRSGDASRRWLHTGGLSALEEAFEALGWDDPHYTDERQCEVSGCQKWASCVAAYPRSLAGHGVAPDLAGFGYLCGDHYRRWNGREPESASDIGRIVSERGAEE